MDRVPPGAYAPRQGILLTVVSLAPGVYSKWVPAATYSLFAIYVHLQVAGHIAGVIIVNYLYKRLLRELFDNY